MRKKLVVFIPVIVFLIFSIINSQYSNVEDKILDDINIGGANNSDFVVELLLIDEPNEDFYICVGETTYGNICVLAIEYNSSSVAHAVKRTVSKDEMFSISNDLLKIDDKKIKFGFIGQTDENDLQTNTSQIKEIPFSYFVNEKEEKATFFYYFE
ncbi:MAG: hypothetical protein IKT89_07375 [Clostridia bacterium]|nr:hypothetical protein [Clostridia bacterium]